MVKSKIRKWKIGKWIGVVSVLALAVILVMLGRDMSSRAEESDLVIDGVTFEFKDGYYLVNTASQLRKLGEVDTTDPDAKFRLVNDIEVDQLKKAATSSFAGEFDGQNHKITYKRMEIVTESDVKGTATTVINEGILFGTVTGTVKNLFVDVIENSKYTFHDTYLLNRDKETKIKYPDNIFYAILTTKGRNDVLEGMKETDNGYENVYVKKEGEDYKKYEGDEAPGINKDTPEKEEIYYYKQVLTNTITKDYASHEEKKRKAVRFGLVGTLDGGEITNLRMEGEFSAQTTENSYCTSVTYSPLSNVDISQYYKVSYSKNWIIKKETETEKYAYEYAYDIKSGKADLDIKLYKEDETPKYEQYEGEDGELWFHIPQGENQPDLIYPVYDLNASEIKEQDGTKITKKVPGKDMLTYRYAKIDKKYNDQSSDLEYDFNISLYDEKGNPIYERFVDTTGTHFFKVNNVKYQVYAPDTAKAEEGDIIKISMADNVADIKWDEYINEMKKGKEVRVITAAQLNVGAVAGGVTKGKISGVIQNVKVNGIFKKGSGLVGEQMKDVYYDVGGIAGELGKEAIVEDCYIGKEMFVTDPINNVLKSSSGDIVGCALDGSSASTSVIDNGSEGTVAGRVSGSVKKENIYTTSKQPGNGITTITPDIVGVEDKLKNWKYFSEDITGEDNGEVYTLNWLVKDCGYSYTIGEDNSVEITMTVTDDVGKNTYKNGILKYHYRYSIDDKESEALKEFPESTDKIDGKSITIETSDLGASAFLRVMHIYNTDGKFYYYHEYDEKEKYIYPYRKGMPEYKSNFRNSLIRDNQDTFVQVTCNLPEDADANGIRFYYITDINKYPISGDPAAGSDFLKAEARGAFFENGYWKVNIPFTGSEIQIKGFWRLDNKTIYPIEESRRYLDTDPVTLPAPEKFSISRYYLEDSTSNPLASLYIDLLDLPMIEGSQAVYQGQNIIIDDFDENIIGEEAECYFLFSDLDGESITKEDIRSDGGKYSFDSSTKTSNLDIPDTYEVDKPFYLHLLNVGRNIDSEITTLAFRMTSIKGVIPSKPSNSVVLSDSSISLDLSEYDETDGMKGIRYLLSGSIFTGTTLANNSAVTRVPCVPGDTVNIPLVRVGDEVRIYVYVQYYGTHGNENICGPLQMIEYPFADKTGSPTITPETISGESGTVGAFNCETNTKAELSAAKDSTIVYYMGENDTMELAYSRVTDESILTLLEEKTQDGQKTYVHIEKLYVKNNGNWYQMSEGAKVYNGDEGVLLTNTSQKSKFIHIFTMAFEEDKEASDAVHYVYEVEPLQETAAPTAVLYTTAEEPTVVSLNTSLFFQSSTPDAEIYYTLDGTVPDTKVGGSTKRYSTQKGILVEGEYSGLFRVNMIAVKKDSTGANIFKPSQSVSFVYRIGEQNTVSPPTSVPTTTDENPTVLSPGKKILLSSETNGAAIYYTVDGSEPVINEDGSVKKGSKYDTAQGIIMPEDGVDFFTIKAIAVKSGMKNSQVVQLTFCYPDRVLPPYASPASGIVDSGTEVTLTNATKDATIYYEIAYGDEKPKTPTVSSAVFESEQPFIITQKTTIKAIAVKDGVKSKSETFTYTTSKLSSGTTVSIPSGSVVARSTLLKITAEEGSAVYYTIDDSEPNDVSNTNVVTGQSLLLDGEYGSVITVKACAKAADRAFSDVSSYTYQISKYQGGVTSDLENGSEVSNGATINLISDITNATIYYTVDGSSPSAGSASGTAAALSGEPGTIVTVKAMAIPEGVTVDAAGSSTAIFNYKIKDTITAPEASPGGGTLTSQVSVTLTAAKGDIYYTTDGSNPTINSTQYKEPITVNKSMVLKAIAATDEGEVSGISTFTYSTAMRAAKPTSSLADGVLQPGTVVKLSSQTSGAAIYFSTDGTTPSTDNLDSLLTYDEDGITINRTVSIQAVAYKDGYLLSSPASFHFEVTDVPAALEREKREAEEAAKGLKDTDATALKNQNDGSGSGPSFTDIILKEADFNTMVAAEEGIISKNTRLIATHEECRESVQKNLQTLLGEEYEMLSMYDMSLYDESKSIQPNGKLEIGIPIPEEYENAAVQIVYVDHDGNIKKHETRRSDGIAYAITDHFSIYGLAGVKNEEKSIFSVDVVYIVVGVAVIVAAFGTIFFIFQIKTKKLPKRVRKNL